MRLIKLLGAMVVVSLVGGVFFVSIAQAGENVALCKANEELCSGENIYPAKTVLKGSSTNTTFSGTLEVSCKVSTIEGETFAATGNPLAGEFTPSTAGECSTCGKIHFDGYGIHFLRSFPRVDFLAPKVLYLQCPFGVSCQFGAEEAHMAVENTESGLLVLRAENIELTQEAGGIICGEKAQWNGTYTITSPDPLYRATAE